MLILSQFYPFYFYNTLASKAETLKSVVPSVAKIIMSSLSIITNIKYKFEPRM